MLKQDQPDQARQLIHESVQLARAFGDKESLMRFLSTEASIEVTAGNLTLAATYAQECLIVARALGTRSLLALALNCLAEVKLLQGDDELALTLLDQRIELAQKLGDTPTVLVKQLYLAEITLHQDDIPQAEAYTQESLDFFRTQNDNPNIAFALNVLGTIRLAQGHYMQAFQLYKEALQIEIAIGSQKFSGKHLVGLLEVATHYGQFEQAALLSGYITTLQSEQIMLPIQVEAYKQTLQRISTQISSEVFARKQLQGEKMNMEQIFTIIQEHENTFVSL